MEGLWGSVLLRRTKLATQR